MLTSSLTSALFDIEDKLILGGVLTSFTIYTDCPHQTCDLQTLSHFASWYEGEHGTYTAKGDSATG